MKTRVNLTIEEVIVEKAKGFAEAKGTSMSQMVEDFLAMVVSPVNSSSLAHTFRSFPKPHGDYKGRDLMKEYFEAHNKTRPA